MPEERKVQREATSFTWFGHSFTYIAKEKKPRKAVKCNVDKKNVAGGQTGRR